MDVKVLSVERERQRIALSLKRLQAEPWTTVEERYQVGQLVTGTITKLASFGAFARLEDNIEGLIHISEMTWNKRVKHPSKIVTVGDTVEVVDWGGDSTLVATVRRFCTSTAIPR